MLHAAVADYVWDEVLAIVRREAIPIDPDSQCEEARLVCTNDGGS